PLPASGGKRNHALDRPGVEEDARGGVVRAPRREEEAVLGREVLAHVAGQRTTARQVDLDEPALRWRRWRGVGPAQQEDDVNALRIVGLQALGRLQAQRLEKASGLEDAPLHLAVRQVDDRALVLLEPEGRFRIVEELLRGAEEGRPRGGVEGRRCGFVPAGDPRQRRLFRGRDRGRLRKGRRCGAGARKRWRGHRRARSGGRGGGRAGRTGRRKGRRGSLAGEGLSARLLPDSQLHVDVDRLFDRGWFRGEVEGLTRGRRLGGKIEGRSLGGQKGRRRRKLDRLPRGGGLERKVERLRGGADGRLPRGERGRELGFGGRKLSSEGGRAGRGWLGGEVEALTGSGWLGGEVEALTGSGWLGGEVE